MNNWIGLQTLIKREIDRFMRVPLQALFSPWVSALLYIFVFGYIIGSRIILVGNVTYIQFVMPGVLMLNIISSSFAQTAFSVYYQRFAKHIEELLVSPLSYAEMIGGFLVGGVARGFIVGAGVYFIALLFDAARVEHPLFFLIYSIGITIVFSFLGILVGLWSENFEQSSLFSTFIILPLTFLGGVFNSMNMLPAHLRNIMLFNPFFYFVDGLRYSMIGRQEAPLTIGIVLMLALSVIFGLLVWYLFKIGWKIKT